MISVRSHIPNFITSLNGVCGSVAIVLAINGRIDAAFPLMLAAAVFDFLDGFAARALGAYSDMGKELDSLCDLISFGVLPAIMLNRIMVLYTAGNAWYCYIPLAIAVFSAIRLAKFNVDKRQTHSFIGLPTPACAILTGAFCYYISQNPDSIVKQWCECPYFLPLASVVLSVLLICEIPMFSIKISKEDSGATKKKRLVFSISCAACVSTVIIAGFNWSLALVFIFLVYIILNLIFALFKA